MGDDKLNVLLLTGPLKSQQLTWQADRHATKSSTRDFSLVFFRFAAADFYVASKEGRA
jgi:hypothetical protein